MKRTRILIWTVSGLALIGSVVAASVGFGGTNDDNGTAQTAPATATIEKATLVESQKASGTVGYGSERTASAAGAKGTLTWLPNAGDVIERGKPAFKVDNKPVPILYGSMPIYRTMKVDVEGPDVKQLQENLEALGYYKGFTIGNYFSSYLATAVRAWQYDLGLEQTGQIVAGSVLLTPGAIRVSDLKAQVGEQPGGAVFTYTGTTRQVTIDLSVSYQRLAVKGAEVSVELPSGTTVKGTISAVASSLTPGQNGGSSTVKVTVSVKDQKALASFDKATVNVFLIAKKHVDVLAVPVSALLALPNGGYAVQLVTGNTTRLVPVTTGAFANGRVEISGSGLSAGMKVGVPL